MGPVGTDEPGDLSALSTPHRHAMSKFREKKKKRGRRKRRRGVEGPRRESARGDKPFFIIFFYTFEVKPEIGSVGMRLTRILSGNKEMIQTSN